MGARFALPISLAVACALGLAPHGAAAQEEQAIDQPRAANLPQAPAPPKGYAIELGAHLGYLTAPVRGGTSPFGAGFGARGGVEFSGVYIGGRITDFIGAKDVDVTYRSLLVGVEAGYGFRLLAFGETFFVLRPTVGAGDVAVSFTNPSLAKADVVTSASGGSSRNDTITVNNVYIEPELTAMLQSASNYVALSGSTLVIPGISPYGSNDSTTWVSYGLRGALGFRF